MTKSSEAQPLPYRALTPGYEAVYTGRKAGAAPAPVEAAWVIISGDEDGNETEMWSLWSWTGALEEKDWDEDIKLINRMQESLGPLSDDVRKIRAHIASLGICDNGVPITIDELLDAIGRGELRAPSFHNGCFMSSVWWEERTTQPHQKEAMQAIEDVLRGYLAGQSAEALIEKHPAAEGFIRRTYECLGPVEELTEVQRLMLERVLLPFDYLTGRTTNAEAVDKDCFGKGGRGQALDQKIAEAAGLPKFYSTITDYESYVKVRDGIEDAEKRELYRVLGTLSHGLHGLSDCHHACFRWIENWICCIGEGKVVTASRVKGTEKERLVRLMFGYVLALDRWLSGVSMHFLLLDLSHVDLGFDPTNE
ncbi:MAG: hypothetical protein JW759_07450, partial [Candidatus Coatesbacteria bacterium]|nr:hypothetical protein [Candidatus Coatesbacteria bacterium]